jgi:hypothetical protein
MPHTHTKPDTTQSMKTATMPKLFLRSSRLAVTALLAAAATLPLHAMPVPPNAADALLAGTGSVGTAGKSFFKNPLAANAANDFARALGTNLGAFTPAERELLQIALETALRKGNHTAGALPATTEQLAAKLMANADKVHGDVFETLLSRQLASEGTTRVFYNRPNNPGTDLQYSRNGKMVFVQAKATREAVGSAKSGLLDALEFLGGGETEKALAERAAHLRDGRFEVRIPSDQFEELVRKGKIAADGTPSPDLAKKAIAAAAKEAAGTGDKAARCTRALAGRDALSLVQCVKIKPGPIAYPALLKYTSACAQVLTKFGSTATGAATFAALKVAGKVANVAGKVAAPLVVIVPACVAAAKLDTLNRARAAGELLPDDEDARRAGIILEGAFQAATGAAVVALCCIPGVGWVGAAAIIGAGVAAGFLVDDAVCQTFYERFIETDANRDAAAYLRREIGERAAFLSGFSIHPDSITDANIRASYRAAWERAGRPAIGLPQR